MTTEITLPYNAGTKSTNVHNFLLFPIDATNSVFAYIWTQVSPTLLNVGTISVANLTGIPTITHITQISEGSSYLDSSSQALPFGLGGGNFGFIIDNRMVIFNYDSSLQELNKIIDTTVVSLGDYQRVIPISSTEFLRAGYLGGNYQIYRYVLSGSTLNETSISSGSATTPQFPLVVTETSDKWFVVYPSSSTADTVVVEKSTFNTTVHSGKKFIVMGNRIVEFNNGEIRDTNLNLIRRNLFPLNDMGNIEDLKLVESGSGYNVFIDRSHSFLFYQDTNSNIVQPALYNYVKKSGIAKTDSIDDPSNPVVRTIDLNFYEVSPYEYFGIVLSNVPSDLPKWILFKEIVII